MGTFFTEDSGVLYAVRFVLALAIAGPSTMVCALNAAARKEC